MRLICLVTITLLLSPTLSAREFHVDPTNGSPAGDGSAASPWRTLQEVYEANLFETQVWSTLPFNGDRSLTAVNAGAPIQAGDTVILQSGHHGHLVINGAINQSTVTIRAADGATPTLSKLVFRGTQHWSVQGLTISPAFGEESLVDIVHVLTHPFWGPSENVRIEDCDIFAERDSSSWSANDWINAPNGINSSADDLVLSNNTVTNTRFGIQVLGERAHVIRNTVRNFSGDALRGLGDDGVFEYNYVANNYAVDDNHDDGFQSWSLDEQGRVGFGEVRGIVLRGNIVINREDNDQNFAGPLQGLVCFDGFATDWIIENNVVVVDHYHGISLSGSRNARIINNTIVDMVEGELGPTWIAVVPHKDGRPSTGNIVRNNLVSAMSNEGGVSEDHNIIFDTPGDYFVNATWPWDLRLKNGAAAIDMASADLAPALDADGAPRLVGNAIDVGAYEWGAIRDADAGPVPLPDATFIESDVVQDRADVRQGSDAALPGGDSGPASVDAGVTLDGSPRQDTEPFPGLQQECSCASTSAGAPAGGRGAALTLGLVLFTLVRRRGSGSDRAR